MDSGQTTLEELRSKYGKLITPEMEREWEADAEERRAKMSPPGALHLPPKLEAVRLEYGITDSAFKRAAVYTRCLVYQVPEFRDDRFDSASRIVLPERTAERERREAPRGIIVSAGLRALDELRSNGMDLGDMVTIIRDAPWAICTDYIRGKWERLLVLQSGDMLASEDLATDFIEGRKKVVFDEELGQHVIEGVGQPVEPFIPGDM